MAMITDEARKRGRELAEKFAVEALRYPTLSATYSEGRGSIDITSTAGYPYVNIEIVPAGVKTHATDSDATHPEVRYSVSAVPTTSQKIGERLLAELDDPAWLEDPVYVLSTIHNALVTLDM